MKTPLALALLLSMSGTVSAQVAADIADKTALTLLDHLDAGRFDAAEALFDTDMRTAVPADRLKAVWQSIGNAGTRGTLQHTLRDKTQFVVVPMQRGGHTWNASIGVDAEGKVNALLVQPAQVTTPVPAVPANANYTEHAAKVGSGADALVATLVMPKGKGPFPAAVLVHGSGAGDQYETIGPNRPFLDVSRGLAEQGIAVLRYDKRAKAMPEWYKTHPLNVDTETTDDAVLALAVLRATPGINTKRLYVIGHSQGAMLAPRIASHDGHVAGVVQWSGPARKIVDVIPDQQRFLAEQQKLPEAKIKEVVSAAEAQIRQMRDPAFNGPSLLGQPAAYWRTIDSVDPVADTKALKVPVLLLQGGRDFQVTGKEWQIWQQQLKGNTKVSMKHYPALNHLGIAGTGAPNPAEYGTPGHVDTTFIHDIAAWIKAH